MIVVIAGTSHELSEPTPRTYPATLGFRMEFAVKLVRQTRLERAKGTTSPAERQRLYLVEDELHAWIDRALDVLPKAAEAEAA